MSNLFQDIRRQLCRSDSGIRLFEDATVCDASEFLSMIEGRAQVLLRDSRLGDRIGIPHRSRIDMLAMAYACFATGRAAVFLPRDEEVSREVLADANALVLPESEGLTSGAGWDGHAVTIDPAVVIYTSGTTASLRKGVLVPHDCISQCAAFMNEAMGVTSEIREMLFAPVDHLYGFGRCHAVLSAGGQLMVATEKSNFGTVLRALEEGFNSLALVPAVLSSLLNAAAPTLRKYGSNVRWIQTGAMRLDAKYRQMLLDVFPNATIGMHYGLTEVMRATFLNLRAEQNKIHTEGRPRPGVLIEIRDENNRSVGPEVEGDVVIAGSALAMGYTRKEEWAKRLTDDGWYRTGDIGLLDEDGYLVFRGRSDDIVNVDGHLVHPMEVEKHLSSLVTSAHCVVGVPDPKGHRDSILVLCVEGDSPPEVQRIAQHLAALDSFKVPRHVLAFPDLPKTVSGKIRRNVVARLAADALRG